MKKAEFFKLTIFFLCFVSACIQVEGQNPVLVDDINTFNWDSGPSEFLEFNNKLYFSADDGIHGKELWECDATNAPIMVADINPGSYDSYPQNLIVFNNKVFYSKIIKL
ncbi:MAG: hypothetical protein JW702_07160 [Clostridiales bacterium]|nr:hypothetical protein [Clostridiales bacterium]